MRYCVKASRRTPTWFHAVEVFFVDAESAEAACADVLADPELEAWEVIPATPAMEAQHLAWLKRCEAWLAAAKTATAKRGML